MAQYNPSEMRYTLTIDDKYYNRLDIEGFSQMMKDPSGSALLRKKPASARYGTILVSCSLYFFSSVLYFFISFLTSTLDAFAANWLKWIISFHGLL